MVQSPICVMPSFLLGCQATITSVFVVRCCVIGQKASTSRTEGSAIRGLLTSPMADILLAKGGYCICRASIRRSDSGVSTQDTALVCEAAFTDWNDTRGLGRGQKKQPLWDV